MDALEKQAIEVVDDIDDMSLQEVIEQALVEAVVSEELEKQAIAEVVDDIDALSLSVAGLTGADPVEIAADLATYVGELLNQAG